ncbi:3-polyprenyl-4-hydroxybenzoate decarboxylase [Oceanicola granulosus HTCC2516]|uniref:Flavin prenyltransferase UbiX n=1 Tax=Oceanicola granulosus (strain ATCC BAA-861 / DSM 15982 / KCTC 12143 / HTCC2516) TaxID=314256 RepID=Q2CGN5_OCEGH|nr:UbiX family flavin prenyltransferase [Oceanicola granulosus]EAR51900.1 3-polyprenyl-4-hydroxybenzoate decarboxylase [Oceanicola granulosus HTCC2516]
MSAGGVGRQRLIVAITGASGVIYGIRALQILREVPGIETHAIISPSAFRTAQDEVDMSAEEMKALPDVLYGHRDIGAALSSGSYLTTGMLVAPCTVKTLSNIATCNAGELIPRAADVCLKERRRLVLMFRETPLHAGHIALMEQATRNGAIVMPPVPAFYSKPGSLEEMVDQSVGRALDLLGVHLPHVRRWTEG